MLTGAIIGAVVAVTLLIMNRSRAKSGTGLPGKIEQTLRGKEPMTLKQIAALVGKDTFLGRGDVAQALAALQSVGKVRANAAPEGTPLRQRVDVVTYEVIATDGPASKP